jgi:hypothetical protein
MPELIEIDKQLALNMIAAIDEHTELTLEEQEQVPTISVPVKQFKCYVLLAHAAMVAANTSTLNGVTLDAEL